MVSNVDTRVSIEEARFLRGQLDAFTDSIAGERGAHDVQLKLLNDQQDLVGGLLGAINWRWLHISVLWVKPTLRGTGQGALLLQEAESIARQRDCLYVKLHTFDFQARPFYEHHGYAVIGETADFPPGHTQYLMKKTL